MERKSKQEQLIIKICCFVAAFILWLYIYNVENPSKDRIVTIPVKIVNQEALAASNLAPVLENDVNMKITIRGNISEIYSVKLDDIKLEADLSSLALKKGENTIPVVVKSTPSGIRVLGSENLNVQINVDELVKKTVPIKVVIKGAAKSGFYAISPELGNKQVTVKGPSKIVDQVKYVAAVCDVSGAAEDVTQKASLQAESENGTKFNYLIIEPDNLNITIPVRKVKTVGINVKLTGNLDSSTLVKSVLPVSPSIEIAANDEVLGSVSSLDTEPVNIKALKGDQSIEAKLVIPTGVTVVNNAATVKLNVTYKTAVSKVLTVPIRVRDLSPDLQASLSSGSISINVSGPEGLINNLNGDNIDCYIELQGVAEGTNDFQVNVKLPDGISSSGINPSKVTAVISSKNTGGQ
ncbi:MAG: YbbR-like domain-containing protein [Solirubrobacterales bacterium]